MSIIIKTQEEISSMQEGGEILGKILYALIAMVEPGITTLDLEKKAEELFKKYKVIPAFKGYHGYPAILCTSVNNQVVHTIPNDKPLKEGDIISIDCGLVHNDLITDSAVATIVGETAPETYEFVKTCIRALWAGINMVRPGIRFGDISHAIGQTVKSAGYSIVEELTGHGVGHKLHEDPVIPNDDEPGTGEVLQPGMTFALEPIITMGDPKIRTLKDGWTIITKDDSLACQHEHTVLVTESGFEVLTLRPGGQTL